jgi:hypothetical protein
VERRQLDEGGEFSLNRGVDAHGLAEALATVHDAVGDGLDLFREGAERCNLICGSVRLDGRKLEACRAGVDDEDRAQGSVRPGPGADCGVVLAVPPCPGTGAQAFVLHFLAQPGRRVAEPRHPVGHVYD